MDRDQLLNDPETALRTALDGRQALIWTSLPAIIQSVNWDEMTLEIQPTVQGVVTNSDGSTDVVNMPLLVDVPIVFPSGGGFSLTFPLEEGDEVLAIIASRCIDAWWQTGGVQPQAEMRMHDLSDGFAIPGPNSLPNVVPNINTTSVQLRNDAGTAYIGISDVPKLQMVAGIKTMKGVLDGMLNLLINLESALSTFASAASAATPTNVTATVGVPAAALATTLATLSAAITTYQSTDVGVLLE